jgi:excisionase family DNA binding protein
MARIVLTPQEACDALRIGRTKLYELFSSGQLRAFALGGKTLIKATDLENFIAALPPIPMQADNAAAEPKLDDAP